MSAWIIARRIVVLILFFALGIGVGAVVSASGTWSYCSEDTTLPCQKNNAYYVHGVLCMTTGKGEVSSCVAAWYSPFCFNHTDGCEGKLGDIGGTLCSENYYEPSGEPPDQQSGC